VPDGLLAGEEFDALVFNAVHGWYRQAIGCLRNGLELMTVAAGLTVTNNQTLYNDWRNGQEIAYGQAVAWLRDSTAGQQFTPLRRTLSSTTRTTPAGRRSGTPSCASTPTAARSTPTSTSG
jgi:hypothetical protein